MNIADKVVCVDDNWSRCWDDPRKWFSSLPVMGRVYVVSACKIAKNNEPMIQLVGISSPCPGGGFYPRRFRLLSEMQAAARAEKEKAIEV